MKVELQQLLNVIQGMISAGVVFRVTLIFQNGRNEEKSMKEICQKAGKVVYAGVIAVSIVSFSDWAYTRLNALQGAGDVSGIGSIAIEFVKLVKNAVTLIAGSLTAWHFIKELLLYQFGDENDKSMHAKGARKQLAIGIVIVCAAGIITAILSYF